jgi:1-acyl-sn-glycerol-3-phosphate acyltransferase
LLRSLLISAPLVVGATILMGTLSVLTSFFDPLGKKQHAISHAWAKMLLSICRVRVRCQGLEKLDPHASYVFVGNHLSLMDTPVVLSHIQHQFLFLVNRKYVQLPFLGTHLRRSGHFPVDPEDMRASLKVMTEAATRIRQRRLSVLLFPEGRRSRAGLQEFKEGAAYIAIKSGAAVVPFALRGTREILPVGSIHVRGGAVDFIAGDPIPVDGLSLKDRAALTGQMRQCVESLGRQLEGYRSERATAPVS